MMKRAGILVPLAGLLLGGPVHAQVMAVGLWAGPSFSTLSTDDPDLSPRTLSSAAFGAFVTVGAGRIAIQPELTYVTKGAAERLIVEELDFRADGQLRLSYIEVPVLIVVPLGARSGVQPRVYAGPALAVEVGCRIRVAMPGSSYSVPCDDADDEVDRRRFDAGAMLGGGLALPVGPGSLLAEARYTLGLTRVIETGSSVARNRSGTVQLGYSLPVGR